MNKPKMTYFEKEDILHLMISDEPESASIELSLDYTFVALIGMLGFSIDFLHEGLCEQTTNSLN